MSPTLLALRKALQRPSTTLDLPEARRAGVAAVFDARGQLVFMHRAQRPGDPWSGHVSFPGGHLHQGESFRQAAERETHEELGLDLSRAELLGQLNDLGTAPGLPSRHVRPHVYLIDHFPELKLDPSEVAGIRFASLDDLLSGKGRAEMTHPTRGGELRLPCVDLNGARLWGMTLMMVDELLDRIDGAHRTQWYGA